MLTLLVKAELQAIQSFGIKDSETEPFFFTFNVECNACHERHSNKIAFNKYETVSLPNSRGEANFVMKCKSCGKDGNISVISKQFKEYENGSKPVELASFECRGWDLIEFIPEGEFIAKAENSNTVFTFEFEDGEFYEYDEKANEEVSITNLEFEIVKQK